jgi:hypothetical protein
MNETKRNYHAKIQEFIQELSGFAEKAKVTLKIIEEDMEKNKSLFLEFSGQMLAIRGTAQQLGLDKIAEIAGLGEEISVKGAVAEQRAQIRRCVGSLWDALGTVKYLLEHYEEETFEEQEILTKRLENTLRILGGPRETMSQEEIEMLAKGITKGTW